VKKLTKAERQEAHRVKMMGKFFRNIDPSFHRRDFAPSMKGKK
jgi:hypothetical protein